MPNFLAKADDGRLFSIVPEEIWDERTATDGSKHRALVRIGLETADGEPVTYRDGELHVMLITGAARVHSPDFEAWVAARVRSAG
jgi:hypothetical protein